MKGKIALITGAANGIGLATTIMLLEQKVHVIAIDNDEEALQSLSNQTNKNDYLLTLVQLDLTNEHKLKEFSLIVQERFGKIDIIIANAAILGDVTPLDHYNSILWQQVINTNINANFWLIKYFHHLLLKSSAPQVIFVACRMSEKNQAYWGAYLVSKTALLSFAKIYIEENNSTTIKVNVVDPGVVETKLRTQAFPHIKHNYKSAKNATPIFLLCLTKPQVEHGNFLWYNDDHDVIIDQEFRWT